MRTSARPTSSIVGQPISSSLGLFFPHLPKLPSSSRIHIRRRVTRSSTRTRHRHTPKRQRTETERGGRERHIDPLLPLSDIPFHPTSSIPFHHHRPGSQLSIIIPDFGERSNTFDKKNKNKNQEPRIERKEKGREKVQAMTDQLP